MQPGDTIDPGSQKSDDPTQPQTVVQIDHAQQAPATPFPQPESPAQPTEQSVSQSSNPEPTPETEKESAPPEPKSQWQFNAEEDSDTASVTSTATHDPVEWTASEYIAHEKGANWYFILGAVVIIFAVFVYLLTQELVSTVVIIIMGAAFGAFAMRKPQELKYRLDNNALHVGARSYLYSQFKSFTVVEEGVIHSIMLMPLQRFMPPLSVYYAPEDEDKIAEALSSYLPYEDRKQDFVDKLMRRIRF
ncbi:hypothetical protein H0X10_02890 [Candidatus Saccharibacteria bacterium]|nr:hypothetical protein [Candidatus Saccharibacteria bacterium]